MGICFSCFLKNDEDVPTSNSNASLQQNRPLVSHLSKPQTPESQIAVSIPGANVSVTPESGIVVSVPGTNVAVSPESHIAIVSEETVVCQELVQTRDERISSSNESVETCCEEFLTPTFEKDECPTCLEEYDDENPKIISECFHHFHLSCIYAWMEKSELCPICSKVMVFNEAA